MYDRLKVPRASLAYINDATAGPLVSLIPITSWAVFFMGVFEGYPEVTNLGSAASVYTRSIPFMFYSWIAMIICLLFCAKIIPPIGQMKVAYKRAKETGELYSEASKKYNTAVVEALGVEDDTADKKSDVLRLICFFVPIVLLVAITIINGDIANACVITVAVTVVLYLIVGIAKWDELMQNCMKGVVEAIPLVLIIIMAYMLKNALTEIGLVDWLISLLAPIMNPVIMPAAVFLVAALLAFATGSNWGIIVVVTAIVMPMSSVVGANVYLIIGALLSGSTFGAHVCFYTDCTIQASNFSGIDNMEHCVTQLPYGIIGGVLSIVAFLIAGLVV